MYVPLPCTFSKCHFEIVQWKRQKTFTFGEKYYVVKRTLCPGQRLTQTAHTLLRVSLAGLLLSRHAMFLFHKRFLTAI